MNIFLRAKHWQLFLLMIGVPMIVEFIGIGLMFTTRNPHAFFFIFPLLMLMILGVFFGWFWTLGTHLHARLPDTVKMNLNAFKCFLLVPAIYVASIFLLISCWFLKIDANGEGMNLNIMPILIPIHLFSMFCIFYCLYFISKELKAVEWQRPVTFSDFAGEFFMIWFYPIGIWIIQPRINGIFKDDHA